VFHTILTSAYILPNIYVFLRIRKNFISKGYRILYTLTYLLLFLIYPLSRQYFRHLDGGLADQLVVLGEYLLPFYLYLFLLVLAFDLGLLVNYFLKLVRPGLLSNVRFRTISLAVIVLLSVGIVIAGIINFSRIRISEYSINVPAGSSKMDRLRLAFVADFHLNESTNIGFVENFVRQVNNLKPDLMLYGGDIAEGRRQSEILQQFESLFKQIRTRYGAFAVLGNHEYYSGHDEGHFFTRSGITLLCDTIITIDSSLNLGGRLDSHFRSRKEIGELMEYSDKRFPLILMDHRPTDLENVSRAGVDVQLSGHTHYGQLFPLNFIIRNIYELGWGYKKKGNTHFFVTSGIRLWGPKVKTAGIAEIMLIDIDFI